MTKVFKIFGRFLGISFEWILIAITAFAFVIRTSTVQTYLAQKATDFLSKELNTTIKIDQVAIVFIDRVALEGVLIMDQNNDTLASIKTIYLSLDELNLEKNYLKLGRAELEKGDIHISREKETGDYNYWFITDYFSTGKTKKGKEPIDLFLKNLKITDVNVKYDDNRKGYSTYGMDYDHLDLKHVFLESKYVASKKGVLTAEIIELKTTEKSGFVLSNLTALATISSKGLKLKNLNIVTPISNIHAPKFNLLMDHYTGFQSFEDSVTFDANLSKSQVSLKDVSYFASALEGMDQQIEISGFITKKVKDLKITNLLLKTGEKTVLRGTINLPDFREFDKSFFNEKIDYAYISLKDLQKIKLPKSSKERYLSFDKYLERLGYFEANDLRLDGFYSQFVVAADRIKTSLGTVKMDNGIMFTENPKNNSYLFEKSSAGEYDVKIEKFQLDKFLNDQSFGLVDGTFSLSGEAFSLADIHFNLIEGNLNRFDYLDYSYTDIFIEKGSFIDKKFIAKIEVKDDNINLVYDGFIDFNGNQHMLFTVDLTKAMLDNLGITQKDSTSLTSKFTINLFGKTSNTMEGSITMDGMLYTEGNKEIAIPSLVLTVEKGKVEDKFTINSAIADVELTGKIDFNTLIADFSDQIVKVFPFIITETTKKKNRQKSPSHFTYSVVAKDLNDFLLIFVPELKVTPGTKLIGTYNGKTENFTMDLTSSKIIYKNMVFDSVVLTQSLTSTEINADYTVKKFTYGDSVELEIVHFKTIGQQDSLISELSWNLETPDESLIIWETSIIDKKHINFSLRPSYFSVNQQRWEIENQSDISIAADEILVSNFKVERNKQYVSLDGKLSHNDYDRLNFKINDINLSQLGSLIGAEMNMKGMMNGWGYISNPYTNLTYIGDATIDDLYLDDREVGDVFVQSEWDKAGESIGLTGDLVYKGNQTFKFDGRYSLEKETDNLDFNLVFDQTDIQFTNAFLDPDVVNNVKGLIEGRLKVTGSPEFPKLDGEVELIGGNAKIELLGVNFGFDGKISADESGFYIDNMPVTDEEGNRGSLIGSVYHNQFADWNFDFQFNLGDDLADNESHFFNFVPILTMDKFLLMNTHFKEGEYYYGKAYVTGTANIFGYADNIDITVDLQTRKGTTINFPMYGVTELDEEESFITFIKKGQISVDETKKIDFTGVNLDLNFRVTQDAELKIIFNDQTGDEIRATGSGDISMKLDNLGDLTLDGTYRVKEGLYNFAMGPIKQPFHIEEGGTITWTGDPYNATLNLKTYYEVNANLSEISPDQLQGSGKGSNQKVLCYLELTESLMKPTINFDIKAPKADETGKALLARITGDKDELNRQFFSLMLWKRFQPLKGSTAAGGSAAMDLVTNQINSMLALVSKDYKLNVNLDADNISGENSYEFGISKGFLDDRLIFTGSFGVENNAAGANQNQSALIGDVSLEYLLNESGTIRINIFNESNDYSIIQDKNLGLFTQGAGLHYQEDFDNMENFKLIQHFLDLFRKKENKRYPEKRKKRQTPVPTATGVSSLFNLPENKTKIT